MDAGSACGWVCGGVGEVPEPRAVQRLSEQGLPPAAGTRADQQAVVTLFPGPPLFALDTRWPCFTSEAKGALILNYKLTQNTNMTIISNFVSQKLGVTSGAPWDTTLWCWPSVEMRFCSSFPIYATHRLERCLYYLLPSKWVQGFCVRFVICF